MSALSPSAVEGFQLSPQQKRLYALQQRDPAGYRSRVVVSIEGPLDLAVLEAALDRLVARHEILRTGFETLPGTSLPVQVIAHPGLVTVEILEPPASEDDWTTLFAYLERDRRDHPGAPDPGARPLRAGLLAQGPDRAFLFLSLPALCADAGTLSLLVQQLASTYASPDEADLPLQYADIAGAFNDLQEDSGAEVARRFWQRFALEKLTLPRLLIENQPGSEDFAPRGSQGALPAPLVDAVASVAARSGASLASALLVAWQALLMRHGQSHEIVAGCEFDGRAHEGLESAMGLFARVLPVRLQTDRETDFAAALTSVDALCRELAEIQDFFTPEALFADSAQGSSHFLPYVFRFEEEPQDPFARGVRFRVLLRDAVFEPFALHLATARRGNGVTLRLLFDRERLEAVEALCLLRHFATLIEGAVADPQAPLGALPLLSAAERQQVVSELNRTQADLPWQSCLHELFAEQVLRSPDETAVEGEEGRLTYRELAAQAWSLAAYLRRLDVGPEVTVAVCVERSFAMVASVLGVLAAGGAYLPLDPDHPPERLRLLLDDARPRVLLIRRRSGPDLEGHAPHTVYLEDLEDVAGEPLPPPAQTGRENLAYVIYTSGSTGRPKGVMVSHGAIVNRLAWMQQSYPLTPADRLLQKTSFTFDAAGWEIFIPLLTGARLVLCPPGGEKDPAYLAAAIADQHITVVQFVPSVMGLVLEEPGIKAFRHLRRVYSGGEALATGLYRRCLEELGVEFVNLYGPTETAIDATAWPGTPGSRRSVAPIGRPISNLRVYLLEDLEPVPVGLPGELYVAGTGLARGYLGRPDLTAASFVPDPFSERPGERLYHTGDLAFYRADGVIEYLGRRDHQVKVRGVRIELDEIATVLQSHSSVRAAAVTLHVDDTGEARLVAYLVPAVEITPAELRAHLESRLPESMVPSVFTFLEALPLLASGKLDRAALPAPEIGPAASGTAYAAPRNPVEEVLAGIWEDLLGVPRIGIHDDFFELGGHSLLATRVVTRLRQVLGVEIRALRSLFEAPTVAGFARVVQQAMQAEQLQLAPPIMAAVGRGDRSPASSAQQRIWLLAGLADAAAYNLTTALRLRGPLNPELLARSFAAIVHRHEALRTSFQAVEGRPVQVIAPSLDLSLAVVDLSPGCGEAEVPQLLAEEARRSFDLTCAPLFRVRLLRLAPEDHVLVCVMHHIIGDGWSTGVLVHEMEELYTAFHEGRAPSLPDLPVQYADYALWQRAWLQGEVLEAQLGYWRRQLAGPLPRLDLPTDRPRPIEQSYRGGRRRLSVPPALTTAVRATSRKRGATLFMTLLAAFDALLHRYSGQEDLLVGTPVANRGRSEIEGLIGVFINMLVLRVDLGDTPSFGALVERCRDTALAAYAHQDTPFERLVDELLPARDVSRSPLFQVMLVLQNSPLPAPRLPGVTVEALHVSDGVAKFDLTLEVAESAGGLAGSLEYVTDLFDAATIDRMAGHWITLLERLVAAPEEPVSRSLLLSGEESWQVLAEWNDTPAPEGGEDLCIHQMFKRQAARTPHHVAVAMADREVTYAEIDRQATVLATELRALGVGAESRVAIHLERSIDMVVALLATLAAGAAYVPLDPRYPRKHRQFILEDSGAAVVITQESLRADLPELGVMVCIDAPRSRAPYVSSLQEVDPDNLAYVIYTSGSTGRPKGVMVTHRTAAAFFHAMDQEIGCEPRVWLAITSISFDISVLELLWTLTRGWQVVLQDDPASLVAPPSPDREQARETIDFSLFYFANDDGEGAPAERYRLLLEGARLADRYGFTAVWTPERHFHSFGGLYPNPSVTSAALAAVTERVQIRAGSVVLPLHSPLRVAEEWSVVDNLSNGRTGISFASGWHADDFVLRPGAYGERREILLRDIERVRRLWRGEALRFPSGTGNDREVEVRIHPLPIQPELPVWLTAAGNPETFRLAGSIGANLLTHLLGQDLDELEEKIAIYRQAWKESGAGSGAGKVTLMVHTFLGDDLEETHRLVQEPFRRYLRNSVGLLANLSRALGQEIPAGRFEEQDMEALLDHAVERYLGTSALIGTLDSCTRMVERLKKIGVNEIACLIDFGVSTDTVLDSLKLLAELSRRSNRTIAREATLAAQAAEHGVTHLQCTPSMARLLAADPSASQALGGLQAMMVGGEALAVDLARSLVQRVQGQVTNLYGPTETTVWSAAQRISDNGTVPIGRPIAGTQIYVVDRDGLPVPIGVPGELLIGGAGVTRGYLDRPSLTAERFVPDFSGRFGARLYRTGDLGRWTSDGRLEFLGRIDQQIKVRGQRVEPAEIEAVIASYPGIAEVVVAAVPADSGDRKLTAYYVPAKSRSVAIPADTSRLHLLPNGLRVAAINDFQARSAYREIFEAEIYLRHGITLEEGDTVFDVGANSGFFSLFTHQRCRRATLYAFEPIPPTFATLEANVVLHDIDARLYPYGLSDREEEAELTFYPNMPGLSGRYSEPHRDKEASKAIILGGLRAAASANDYPALSEDALDELLNLQMESRRYVCRLRTLSDVLDEEGIASIDLLKVDVERAEVDVLRGIREPHWSKIRQVVMEVDTRENLAAVTEILRAHLFKVEVEEFAVVESDGKHAEVSVFMLYARHPSAADRARGRAPLPVRETDGEVSTARLRAYVKDLLPESMVPAAFVRMPHLPRTPNGKVDRRALPAPSAEVDGAGASAGKAAPRTPVEKQLVELWRQVLHVERVGIHDNFFELGGDSILGIQFISRAGQVGLSLTPRQLFRYQTIAELAQVVSAAPEAPADQGEQVGDVPLTPIQHWFFEQELPAPHHFNQSLLLRVRRALDLPKLAAAVAHLAVHHDALRLSFTREEGHWSQLNTPSSSRDAGTLVHFDLEALPSARRADALSAAAASLQGSLDLESSRLLRVALFTGLTSGERRLLIVIHHLAVDGISWRVLLEDLHTAYAQLERGEKVQLPTKTTSFKRWAEWLSEHAASPALQAERSYWLASVPGEVKPVPRDFPGRNVEGSTETVTVALDPEETRSLLQDLPVIYRSQIDDVLLTALLLAYTGWTGESRLLIDMERHGREEILEGVNLSRTVGWFSTFSPLLLEMGGAADSVDLLRAIKEKLRRVPGRGIGYGMLRYLSADPQLAASLRALPQPEISFNYLGQLDQALADSPLLEAVEEPGGAVRAPGQPRRYLLDCIAWVSNGRLRVQLQYSREVHRKATIERLGAGFINALRSLLGGAAGRGEPTFALSGLDRSEMERLVAEHGPVDDVYPLSPVQQGLLLETLRDPQAGLYVNQISCLLRGPLDMLAFEFAWRQVFSRHPVLRTSFAWHDLPEPMQIVHREVDLPLARLDWTDVPQDQQRTRLEHYLEEDRRSGYALDRAPLSRLALVHLGENLHQMVWSHHHLLLDGWSEPLVVGEVLAVYESFRRGAQPLLGRPRPYRDFIEWLRHQDLTAAERYWRAVLRGFAAPLHVPRDVPPEAHAAPSYGEEEIALSESATTALQVFAQQQRITLNTAVQGAWLQVLSELTSSRDLVIGIVSSGRPAELAGVEEMVGNFINTLPLRAAWGPDLKLQAWLRDLQERQAELLQYEYSPLIEVQGWSEVPRGTPLFETVLVFENFPSIGTSQAEASSLEVAELRSSILEAFPFTLIVHPGRRLMLRARHDRRLFTGAMARRTLAHVARLLTTLPSQAQLTLAELTAQDKEAERRVLAQAGEEAERSQREALQNLKRRGRGRTGHGAES